MTRKTYAIFVLLLCVRASVWAQLVREVGPIEMTVSDLGRSVRFYTDVLHFSKVSEGQQDGARWDEVKGVPGVRLCTATLRLGEERIQLTQYVAPQGGRSVPSDSRSNDRWFQHIAIIVSDMGQAYAWLRRNKVVHGSSSPQTLPASVPAAAGIRAFYFKDPDNHSLEILQFPPDKGAAKWHRAGAPLFMGIDHTAIVVRDTDASLHFYHDLLGMDVAGESDNFGYEQEHLNNVFGAHLHITSVRAQRGPGVELLEYLAPTDGRSIPCDLRANDVAHWETHVSVSAFPGNRRPIRVGNSAELLMKDPDGHVVTLEERIP